MSSQTDDITQHPEPDTKDARIAALETDNARLMGLVKEAREQVAHMAEEYQRDSTWDLLERIDATLAKIKEATNA